MLQMIENKMIRKECQWGRFSLTHMDLAMLWRINNQKESGFLYEEYRYNFF